MRTLLSLFALLLISTVNAQITGYNHIQSYQVNTSKLTNENTVFQSISTLNEKLLAEYNYVTKEFKYLNDSITTNYSYTALPDGKGYATGSNNSVYYTYDNWKTIIKNPTTAQPLSGVREVSGGYLGYKKTLSTGEVYFSEDLINWTKVTEAAMPGSIPLQIIERQGKILVFSSANRFNVSYDGGATFEVKTTTVATTDPLTDLVVMPDTNKILATTSTDYLFTKDGGKNWLKYTKSNAYFPVYAEDLDSIYFTSSVVSENSIYLSLDTGRTFSVVGNVPVKGRKITKDGDYYFVDGYYSKSLTEAWEQIPLRALANICIDVKNEFILIGGEAGKISYSHDNGLTYKNTTIAGAKDIMAVGVINDTLMLASDRESDIYRSADAGLTWTKQYNSTSVYIGRKFEYTEDLSLITLSRSTSGVLASKDGGLTWASFYGPAGALVDITPNGTAYSALNAYIFVDGMAAQKQAIEKIETNGSIQRILVLEEENLNVIGVKMYNDNIGYYFAKVAGFGQNEVHVFKTTDAWANYSFQGTFTDVDFGLFGTGSVIDIYTPAEDTIFIHLNENATTPKNELYYSYNGGKNWSVQTIKTNKFNSTDRIVDIHFYDTQKFIAITNNARIFLNYQLDYEEIVTSDINVFSSFTQQEAFSIFPNPVKDHLFIYSEKEISKVEIYNNNGSEIYSGNTSSINTELFEPGVYLIKIYANKETYVSRFMKM